MSESVGLNGLCFAYLGLEGSEEADLEKIAAQERKKFSYKTLSRATDNFHASNKLGQGGFGPVYKVINLIVVWTSNFTCLI